MEVRTPSTPSEFGEYYALRHAVLRQPWGKPVGSERDDIEDQAIHAALFESGKIIAVGRLQKNDSETGQVRYMAVHPDYQNKGLGGHVLKFLEKKAAETGLKTIILQAREEALNFYKKNGYNVKEKSFLMYEAIQHYLMEKQI